MKMSRHVNPPHPTCHPHQSPLPRKSPMSPCNLRHPILHRRRLITRQLTFWMYRGPILIHHPPVVAGAGAGLVHRHHRTPVKSGDPLDWYHRDPRRSDRDRMILHSRQRRRPGRSEDLVPVFFVLMFLSCGLNLSYFFMLFLFAVVFFFVVNFFALFF